MNAELKAILSDIRRDVAAIKAALALKDRVDDFKNFCAKNANLSAEDIICVLVCERLSTAACRITVQTIKGKRRDAHIVTVRHTAMKIIKDITDIPLDQIGEFFEGNKSVSYGIAKVEKRLKTDEKFRAKFNSVEDECRSTILQSGC